MKTSSVAAWASLSMAFLMGCPPGGGGTRPPSCGNGLRDPGENCDGTDLGMADCTTIGRGFSGGTLACNATCLFDTTGCTSNCGNGQIDTGEACDGTNFNGATCITLGHTGGTLACAADCGSLDTTGCTMCGNGVLETGEVCDGTNLGGATCATKMLGTGTLGCTAACTFDASGCSASPTCGNNIREGTEECDGTDLAGQTCETFFLTSGSLSCTAGCRINRSACLGPDLRLYTMGLWINLGPAMHRASTCEVALGCAPDTTSRRVLNFTLVSENIGTAPLHFGNSCSAAYPYTSVWTNTPPACGYCAWVDYASYWMCPSTVADCAGAPVGSPDRVASGQKASFCFEENFGRAPDYTGTPASCGAYSCGDMGQQPGCADEYYVGLDCQWVDISALPTGMYTLCAMIDPNNHIFELDETNNISCITGLSL